MKNRRYNLGHTLLFQHSFYSTFLWAASVAFNRIPAHGVINKAVVHTVECGCHARLRHGRESEIIVSMPRIFDMPEDSANATDAHWPA
jgi:hypothetical protein